ncbi:lysostaphin resistance A-like protein [Dermabacteraceae bacterium P9123]
MTSTEITLANPPRHWVTPILWSILIFFVPQLLLAVPLIVGAMLLNLDQPGQIMATLISFAGPLAAVLLLNRYLYKRPVTALGFHRQGWGQKYLTGAGIGLLLIVFTCGGAAMFGALRISFNPEVGWLLVFLMLLGFMLQGMTEEVICRGYLQNGLRVRWGIVGALIIQAVFFALLHGTNSGITVLPLVNLFLYGLLIGALFYYTDSMWLVGGLHSAWNFLLGPVLGVEVSGIVIPGTVFKAKASGADWLSGGAFGIEGSVLTTLAMLIGLTVIYFLDRKRRSATAQLSPSEAKVNGQGA